MPSLADLLRNDPWGAPPQTPLAKTVTDVGFDPSLGFAGAVQTYLSRLKKMQGGLAQDMLDTAADPNAEGIQRAANLLGGLGLKVMNVPMALMPSSQELRDRGYQAGASPEVQALGGALGDAVNIPDPATVGPALATLVKAGATAKGLAAAAAHGGPAVLKSMFIGPGAKTFPHAMVPVAEGLENAGKTAEEVHAATGLHRGADGKWRAEIDDSRATINQDKITPEGARFADVYNHPDYFAAYPQLADRPVYKSPEDMNISFVDPADGSMHLGADGDIRQVIPHEGQHFVQGIEGWARGGNSAEFSIKDQNYGVLAPEITGKAATLRMLADHYGDWNKAAKSYADFYSGTKPSDFLNQLAQRYDHQTLRAAEDPVRAYYNLGGEVEARNTGQNRLYMTSAQRAASFPRSTETDQFGLPISQEDQILRFDKVGGPQMAPLGKGLASLMADASPAEQAALKARLEAEAGQALNGRVQKLDISSIDHGESAMPGGKMDEPGAWDLIRHYASLPTKAPPIEVVRDGGRWMVYDGSHRLEAAKLRGDTHIDAVDVGGQASSVSRDQALNGLTGNIQPEWVGRATLEGDGPFQGYHGSPNEITGPLKASSRGAWGPGGYSSMVPSVGKMYGGNLYTTEIDGRLFNGNAWLPESARKDVLSSLNPDEAAKVADWWKEGSMLKGEDLWNIMSRKLGPERTQEFLKAHGFDGISGNMDGHEYVTFDPAKTRITGRSQ